MVMIIVEHITFHLTLLSSLNLPFIWV